MRPALHRFPFRIPLLEPGCQAECHQDARDALEFSPEAECHQEGTSHNHRNLNWKGGHSGLWECQ